MPFLDSIQNLYWIFPSSLAPYPSAHHFCCVFHSPTTPQPIYLPLCPPLHHFKSSLVVPFGLNMKLGWTAASQQGSVAREAGRKSICDNGGLTIPRQRCIWCPVHHILTQRGPSLEILWIKHCTFRDDTIDYRSVSIGFTSFMFPFICVITMLAI